MYKIKLLITVVLVALLMSVEPDAVVAQKPSSTESKGHLLIQPLDVRPFGNVQVLTPEGTVEKGGPWVFFH